MKNKVICEIEGVDIVQEKPILEVDWHALSAIGIHATKKQTKKIKRLVKRGKIRKAQKLVLRIVDDWEKSVFDYIKAENERRKEETMNNETDKTTSDYDDFEDSEEYKNTFIYRFQELNRLFMDLIESIKYEFNSYLRKIIYDTTYFNSIGYVYKHNRFTGRKSLRKLSALERVGVTLTQEQELIIKKLSENAESTETNLIEAQKLICDALNPPFFPEEEIR